MKKSSRQSPAAKLSGTQDDLDRMVAELETGPKQVSIQLGEDGGVVRRLTADSDVSRKVTFSSMAPSEDSAGADSDREPHLERDMSIGLLYKLASEAPDEHIVAKCKDSAEAKGNVVSLVSGLYALILVILTFAFEVSIVVSETVNKEKYEPFFIYLYGIGISILLGGQFFLLRRNPSSIFSWKAHITAALREHHAESPLVPSDHMILSRKRKVTYSAPTAGSLYLRLGCVVFGLVGMIHHGMDIFSCFEETDFCHWPKFIAKCLAAIFIFVQMYFIFQNSKMIIHRYRNIGRIGTMHLVATNLCVWIRYLVMEEAHILHQVEELAQGQDHHGEGKNETSGSWELSRESSEEEAASLEHVALECRSGGQSNLQCHFTGFKPFMVTCIIEYSIIGAAVMYVLWRNIGLVPVQRQKYRKQHFRVDCSSSTLGLFLGLLFVVCTIVSMIAFLFKMSSQEALEAIWIFYISDSILYVFGIGACVAGMVRMRNLSYVAAAKDAALFLDDILLFVGLVGQLMFCLFSIVPLSLHNVVTAMTIVVSLLRLLQVLLQTAFIVIGQRLAALTPTLQRLKPGRQIVTFLLMANLALFLINTFETQKASANPIMTDFYGKGTWTAIVYSTVPLTIFYRFHSSVCLAEIWKNAFRVKAS